MMAFSGTSEVTTAPAPRMAPSPTRTPSRTLTPRADPNVATEHHGPLGFKPLGHHRTCAESVLVPTAAEVALARDNGVIADLKAGDGGEGALAADRTIGADLQIAPA